MGEETRWFGCGRGGCIGGLAMGGETGLRIGIVGWIIADGEVCVVRSGYACWTIGGEGFCCMIGDDTALF